MWQGKRQPGKYVRAKSQYQEDKAKCRASWEVIDEVIDRGRKGNLPTGAEQIVAKERLDKESAPYC